LHLPSPSSPPIVALGGSAGSFNALNVFLKVMPADCGLAFVIITHLDPNHPTMLPNVIRNWTTMRVVQAHNRQTIEPNCVYVIPSGKFLHLDNSCLRLSALRAQPGTRRAIDIFLTSLAEAQGRRGAAVLFSGADADGSGGIAQVKDAGGLTIAQKPEEAACPFMPEAAIATGKVDHVLPVAEIAARLLEHFPNRPKRAWRQAPSLEDLELILKEDSGTLREILSTLREQTGHDFTHYRQPSLRRRLSSRMQFNGVDTLPDNLGDGTIGSHNTAT
jgi:two-component system CheB/CheR fusion protein